MIVMKTFIIAEAGVNHNGSPELAQKLVDAAADAGADAVKFQTFTAQELVTMHAPKANYQLNTTESKESQFEMLKKLELSLDSHKMLYKYCNDLRIEFISTPFTISGTEFLAKELNVEKLKISSGDLTNAPLLLYAARTGKPIILSTGMSTLEEIEEALCVIAFGYMNTSDKPGKESFKKAYHSCAGRAALMEKVSLLHCTTEYPTPFDEVNLRAMDTLRDVFGVPVGLSDHTQGFAVALAAVARGASIIEKHFTFDRSLPGPDHKASLEPKELASMVSGIRQIESALGSAEKIPTSSEFKNRMMARKSLVANQSINRGERFNEQNLSCKRPGGGIAPGYYWEFLGKTANRDYMKDELIQ